MPTPGWANYNPATRILTITCQLCNNRILWNPVDPATVILSITASVGDGGSAIKYHSIICPFLHNNSPCQTVYEIKYNHSTDNVLDVNITPQGWYERMLMDMAKRWQENTIPTLDKRAEYMITTIVGLIAVNFGIIYVFN
ncbi:MAG TPA: hypothetical protein VFT71_05565, partial [Candidatus Nitrosocosmicus sp.]|nr:hypothetical protein [Candidatus Nitrosocosmicus sp.]